MALSFWISISPQTEPQPAIFFGAAAASWSSKSKAELEEELELEDELELDEELELEDELDDELELELLELEVQSVNVPIDGRGSPSPSW